MQMNSPGPLLWLFVLAIPVATVSWTITHEEIFREVRDWCAEKSKSCAHLYQRKFFYLLTCEFCLSHYVSAAFLLIARYKLMFADWRGYLIAWLSLVWVANLYMSIFGRLRLNIQRERVEITAKEPAPTATYIPFPKLTSALRRSNYSANRLALSI